MMTKVTYLLHARADEDLRSGPLTATDTRQSTGESRQALLERARHVPERRSRRGQSWSLTDKASADPQVSQSAADSDAAPQTSQADSTS